MGVVVIWSSDPLVGSNKITSLSRDIFKNFSLCLFDSPTWKLWCLLLRANCDSFMDQAFLPTAFRGSFCISLPFDRISLKQTCILFHSGPFYLTVLASSQRRALSIWAQPCFSWVPFSSACACSNSLSSSSCPPCHIFLPLFLEEWSASPKRIYKAVRSPGNIDEALIESTWRPLAWHALNALRLEVLLQQKLQHAVNLPKDSFSP